MACEYCLSAHTAIGEMVGWKEEDILASRKFNSGDPKIDAALRFSRNLVSRRGQVDQAEIGTANGWLQRRRNRRDHHECRAQHVHKLF
jgi:hypothetical protein